MAQNPKEFFTLQETAKILGLHTQTIRRHIKNGTIQALNVGIRRQHFRISQKSIDDFLKNAEYDSDK